MDKLGLQEGQVIEHPWVTGSIEIAQRRVEQHNFEIRKQLLEYDNVMNKQREIIYGQRRQTLEGASLEESVLEIAKGLVEKISQLYLSDNATSDGPDINGLLNAIKLKFGLEIDASKRYQGLNKDNIKEELCEKLVLAYEEKEKSVGVDLMQGLVRMVFLQIIDSKWKDHLYAMDSLKEGIGLRAYGQRDPLVEYKREAFDMFGQMIASIEEDAVEAIFKLQPAKPERFRGVFSSVAQEFSHPEVEKFEKPEEETSDGGVPGVLPPKVTMKPIQSSHPKVGRNDPCPCGKINPRTGNPLKYKKCCYPKYG
jgi:preprotein translocase subunit SecA